MKTHEVVAAWGKILSGRVPILSIEITRECPLSCPGCYAYGDDHLGGGKKLVELSDFRGDELVARVLDLVDQLQPLHVSLVGGEPLVRHKELSRILPALSARKIDSMITTSAVVPIPMEWMSLPQVRLVVSVDGLPAEHDVRRKPATYERILKNIEGRFCNIHLTITRQMTQRPGYLEEFFTFWDPRPEVHKIWFSLYTPQIGEQSEEMLTLEDRRTVTAEIKRIRGRFPKLLMNDRMADAFLTPPSGPENCIFSKMSVNYSADLKTRVEPCIYGGNPDCSQCGCAATAGLEAVGGYPLAGPLTARHVMNGSVRMMNFVGRFRSAPQENERWLRQSSDAEPNGLVQIHR